MKKILIVNGHQYHERSKGEYNRTLIKTAEDFLARNQFLLKKTVVDEGYDIQIERDTSRFEVHLKNVFNSQ